jgi:hypothetical protein
LDAPPDGQEGMGLEPTMLAQPLAHGFDLALRQRNGQPSESNHSHDSIDLKNPISFRYRQTYKYVPGE